MKASDGTYKLYVYIFKTNRISPSNAIINEDYEDYQIHEMFVKSPSTFKLHESSIGYPIAFQNLEGLNLPADNIKINYINLHYKKYFAQIVDIITQIGLVLATRIQIYPECESAYEDFTCDLLIESETENIYLAEVNAIPGYNMHITENNSSTDLNLNIIFESKMNRVISFNNTIIDGIIKPILENQEVQLETDYYKAVLISEDLLKDPNRIRKNKDGVIETIPIHSGTIEQRTNTTNFINKCREKSRKSRKSMKKQSAPKSNNPYASLLPENYNSVPA